ncbi:MAG: lysylphosphatidylglycerol synthase transmembrane domain-containing protein [Pseudomonadota bacterium]
MVTILKSFFKKYGAILLTLLLLVYIAFLFSSEQDSLQMAIEKAVETLSLPFIGGLLLLSIVNYIMRGLRWHLLASQFADKYSLKHAFWDYFAGFAFTVTPAKAGELIRSHYLTKRFGLRYIYTIIPSLYDRINDFLVLFLVTLLGSLFYYFEIWVLAILLFVGILFFTFFISPPKLICFIKMAYAPFKIMPKAFAKLMLFCRYCNSLKSARVRILAFIMGLIGWGAEFYAFYILCSLFGLPISFTEASFIFSASTIAGSLLMTPGGTGGAEAAMAGLLMVSSGASAPLAAVLTIIIRITTLWFSVLLGVVTLLFHRIERKN